jgi:serine protease Do
MMNTFRGGVIMYAMFLMVGAGAGAFFSGQFFDKWFNAPALSWLRRENPGRVPGADTVVRPNFVDTIAADSANSRRALDEAAGDIAATRSTGIVRATKKVSQSVVGIIVTQIQVVRNSYYAENFFDLFFGSQMLPRYQQVENMGSGFVIDKGGYILTNYHVVEGAQRLFVNFPDGRQIEGSIAGIDPQSDLALVKVKGSDFECLALGNSDDLMIGEWAIAVGNPFLTLIVDAHPTVTVGVISAVNRNFAPSEGVYYQGMIQTDAAINPGNSGGPLVNALGEVIGINTFIFTGGESNKGSIGIGFAIPINRAKRVAAELRKYGKRRPVWTGIAVQNLNPSLAMALGYAGNDGVAVADVQRGSPGDVGGLLKGDIIMRMGARKIQSTADIDGFFLDYFVGDTIQMSVSRKGKTKTIVMTLREYKGQEG